MSLRDVNMLLKKGLYRLETGVNQNLIYDKNSGEFVGHIESGQSFSQSQYYTPSLYVIQQLESYNGEDWRKDSTGWNTRNSW